jgi:transposase-like protein
MENMEKKARIVEKIVLPYGNAARLAAHFGVSSCTVRNALKYAFPENAAHERIRIEALKNYGGVHIERSVTPTI